MLADFKYLASTLMSNGHAKDEIVTQTAKKVFPRLTKSL